MQGAYGGLVVIMVYAGAGGFPPEGGFFLQTDETPFLLTNHTDFLLAN
jgi:hypothetical protein